MFNEKDKLFTEDSELCPVNYYGKTKQLAEEAVKDSGLDYLILRTDQPYGRLETWQKDDNVCRVVKKLQQGAELTEPIDWYNNPTYIEDFVDATARLIKNKNAGTYNLVGPDFINRYDWALKIALAFDFKKFVIKPVSSEAFNLPAKRPMANLSNEKAQKDARIKFLSVDSALEHMKKLRPAQS